MVDRQQGRAQAIYAARSSEDCRGKLQGQRACSMPQKIYRQPEKGEGAPQGIRRICTGA